MSRKYIKTFEQYIAEEGDAPEEVTGADNAEETPDKDPDKEEKEKPDYSEVAPTPTLIMQALNQAGFEVNQDDIMKWDGGDEEDDEGELLVKVEDDDKYFDVDNGLLYYQIGSERVMLGRLNDTEDLVVAIKDYFDVKDEEEKAEDDKKDKEQADAADAGAEDAADDATDAEAEDDLGL